MTPIRSSKLKQAIQPCIRSLLFISPPPPPPPPPPPTHTHFFLLFPPPFFLVSSETFSVATTTSAITTTPGGHVPVETEVYLLNTEDPKTSAGGLTMVPFGVSIIAATGIVLIIVTIVSIYDCVVLKRIGESLP